ncbi:hypothetical protein C1646_677678 [Rhizophagus diaphanus]|nr:hypothetical protein C1646_677678 [Rhizophagus diaphanus] [Rhizophagus sp. MUCL 43196]
MDYSDQWNTLSQNYPESKDYLNRSLGQNPQSWARAFTNKYFTAGVQSTSHSEGENSTLKWLFRNSSLSLCELFDALEERYQEENDYCDFVSWKKSVPQIGPKNVFKSIFGPVVKQLTEFIFPNIIKKQEEQIDLSLCYHAVQIVLKNALPREKIFSQVLEIWEVNHLVNLNTSHFICLLDNGTFFCMCMAFKTLGYHCHHFYCVMTLISIARFHISLINNCWYKESLQGKNISSYEFVVISNLPPRENHILPSQFLSPDSIDAIQIELSQIGDIEVSKVILKKRKFGELFSLGRKIISDVIEDGDEETYNEVLNFLQSIQQRRQRIFHNNNNVNINIVGIQNPVARISKDRPKLKSTKGALKESSNKSQYSCKICKQLSHNSKICKGKGKENQDNSEEMS